MSEVVAVEWRTAQDTVGFVLVRTNMGKFKAYMGVGHGADEASDIEQIKAFGVKLRYREAVAFFPALKEEEYDGK